MEKETLGRRLAEARELAGMTQETVARAVDLDRTAIVMLEKGERNCRVPELVRIAQTLGRPLSYFVEPPVPAAVSRRSAPHTAHQSTRALDVEIDQFAADVRTLLEQDLLSSKPRTADARVPRDHRQAEDAARSFRRRIRLDSEPIDDLGRACDALGLLTLSIGLGETGPDGGCVEVETATGELGAAVVNADAPSGRRRMTLAHELGHWLFGDAYDTRSTSEDERMINSFAIHFLAPRAGVTRLWSDHDEWPERDRALAVGAAYRLSWSATVAQLRNVDLVSQEGYEKLAESEPRSGDYLRLALTWSDELGNPYLSPGFVAACLRGYTSSRLTEPRTLELLRGSLSADSLPEVESPSLDHLRRSFEDHGTASPDA